MRGGQGRLAGDVFFFSVAKASFRFSEITQRLISHIIPHFSFAVVGGWSSTEENISARPESPRTTATKSGGFLSQNYRNV